MNRKTTTWLLFLAVMFCGSNAIARENFWDGIRTGVQYLDALAAADSLTFLREFEYPFLLLLDDIRQDFYRAGETLGARKEYIRNYWKRENPNPLYGDNLWLLDFIERTRYVREHFSKSEPPFFDDRGVYYLKYGKPKTRYIRSQRTELLEGGDPNGAKFFTKDPTETWSYENIAKNFVVHFEAQAPSPEFQEVSYPGQLLNVSPSDKAALSWKLLEERFFYSPMLTEIYEQVQSDIDDGRVPAELAWQNGWVLMQTREQMAKLTVPVSVPGSKPPEHSLAYSSDIAQFRGPEGATRLEIGYRIPFEENMVEEIEKDSTYTFEVEYSGMIRNLDYDPVIQAKSSGNYVMTAATAKQLPNVVGSLSLIAPPQAAELTLQAKNRDTGTLGYVRQLMDIRDFSGSSLMISDLQFFTEVQNAAQRNVLPSYVSEGFEIAPYPFETIHKSQPVLFHFEVYNLVAGGLSGHFSIEITVEWDESRESKVRKLFDVFRRGKSYSLSLTQDRTVTGNTSSELIAVDLSTLRNGPYTVSISVADPEREEAAATVHREIEITD